MFVQYNTLMTSALSITVLRDQFIFLSPAVLWLGVMFSRPHKVSALMCVLTPQLIHFLCIPSGKAAHHVVK